MSHEALWVLGVVVGLALAAVYLFRAFNGPDGERYLRRDTQGPLVPLEEEDRERRP